MARFDHCEISFTTAGRFGLSILKPAPSAASMKAIVTPSARAALEGARAKVSRFIGARSEREIVFTKNATEALNLVAKAWGRANLRAGDPVVVTELEHHANIVPWHQLVDEVGIELRWIPVGADGHLDLTDLDRLLDGARGLSFAAMSNVLGTMTPVERLVAAAHDAGAIAVVDASQHVPHVPTDVAGWGADFAAFTGHKMCGPTGIGVLWGTETILDATPPFLTGGEMILNVTKEGFTANELPWQFEAGTPPIAEAVGLGAAVDYLAALGMAAVREHEVALTGYTLRSLAERFGDERARADTLACIEAVVSGTVVFNLPMRYNDAACASTCAARSRSSPRSGRRSRSSSPRLRCPRPTPGTPRAVAVSTRYAVTWSPGGNAARRSSAAASPWAPSARSSASRSSCAEGGPSRQNRSTTSSGTKVVDGFPALPGWL